MNLADRSTTIQCYYPKNAMNNSSGFAGDDLLVLNTSSLQLSVSSCCTLLAVSELQFRWDAIELHSSVLIMRIKRLCEFAGDDVQVSLVHVRGAGPHFSRNSSISGWFNRARQQSRWIFITNKWTSEIGDNSALIHGPFHRNRVTRKDNNIDYRSNHSHAGRTWSCGQYFMDRRRDNHRV